MARRKKDKHTLDMFAGSHIERVQAEWLKHKDVPPHPLGGAFSYQGLLYVRCVPSQHLMRSTYLYNAHMSGAILAIRLHDGRLTSFPKGTNITPRPDAKILNWD